VGCAADREEPVERLDQVRRCEALMVVRRAEREKE
jgi:hypothetical protein